MASFTPTLPRCAKRHRASRRSGTRGARPALLCSLTFTRLHVMPALPIFLTEHPALDMDVVLEDRDLDLIAAPMMPRGRDEMLDRGGLEIVVADAGDGEFESLRA